MKKTLFLFALMSASVSALANDKDIKCRQKYTAISCQEVKESKRSGFCWKGNLTDTKKDKICKTAKKRKNKKRTAKS